MSRLLAAGTTGLGTLALSVWYFRGHRTAKNAAFVFVPPTANNSQARALLGEALLGDGMHIVREGDISNSAMNKGLLLDKHHFAIASKAVLSSPSQLQLSAAEKKRFRDTFGVSWDHAISAKLVFNALEACTTLACTTEELNAAWLECQTNGKFARLGDSFECGYLQVNGTNADLQRRQGIFVINGSFAHVRHEFLSASSGLHYYEVDLDESKLSWESFHQKITSLGDLHIHASASPFEALANRMTWLGTRCQKDSYCRMLLQAGVQESTINFLLSDPEVVFHGGGRGRVLQAFKGLDTKKSVDYAVTLQAALADAAGP